MHDTLVEMQASLGTTMDGGRTLAEFAETLRWKCAPCTSKEESRV